MTYNRAEVDLTNCDREPIHIPGSIQPHGAMLVVDSDSAVVTYVSENIQDYIGVNGEIIGASVAEILGSSVAHDVANAAAKSGGSHVAGVLLNARIERSLQPTDVTVHRHEGCMFVELEPSASAGRHRFHRIGQ